MKLSDDDFTLFGLAPRQALDRAELDARRRELQAEVHPDRFATDGAAAQRVAMQWSARINEAYQRLKDPLKRAAYLCELGGALIQAHSNTGMPTAFLMQQMRWREDLDEAQNLGQLETLRDNVELAKRQLQDQCAQLLDVQHDYAAAVQAVREWMFIDKFAQDLDRGFDKFE